MGTTSRRWRKLQLNEVTLKNTEAWTNVSKLFNPKKQSFLQFESWLIKGKVNPGHLLAEPMLLRIDLQWQKNKLN